MQELFKLNRTRPRPIILIHHLLHLLHRLSETKPQQRHLELIDTDRVLLVYVQTSEALMQSLDIVLLVLEHVRLTSADHPVPLIFLQTVLYLAREHSPSPSPPCHGITTLHCRRSIWNSRLGSLWWRYRAQRAPLRLFIRHRLGRWMLLDKRLFQIFLQPLIQLLDRHNWWSISTFACWSWWCSVWIADRGPGGTSGCLSDSEELRLWLWTTKMLLMLVVVVPRSIEAVALVVLEQIVAQFAETWRINGERSGVALISRWLLLSLWIL